MEPKKVKTCPRCYFECKATIKLIDKHFGYRYRNSFDYEQSHCKDCRKAEGALRRAEKRDQSSLTLEQVRALYERAYPNDAHARRKSRADMLKRLEQKQKKAS